MRGDGILDKSDKFNRMANGNEVYVETSAYQIVCNSIIRD